MPRRRISAADKKPTNDNTEADVAEVTAEIFGSEVPKNTDGTIKADAELEPTQIKRIGALGAESVQRNRMEASKIKKARSGEAVRWNEDDARIMFDYVKKSWPTGVKIIIKRINHDEQDFRPIEVSALRDSTAFYDYVTHQIHKSHDAAVYSCVFRDGVERGKAYLKMPDTTAESVRNDAMAGGNGMPGGGMPYPPQQPPWNGGYSQGYSQGYPQGYPQQQLYPQQQQQLYPQQQPYPQQQQVIPPQVAPSAPIVTPVEQPYAQQPSQPVQPVQAQQSQVPQYAQQQYTQQPPPPVWNPQTQQWMLPQQSQYAQPLQPPPRDSALEAQVYTMYQEGQRNQEIMRSQQLQLERTLGMFEALIKQGQPVAVTTPQSQVQPVQPQFAAPGGFAHVPPGAPPGLNGAGPGFGAPAPYIPQQQPQYTQPQYQQPPPPPTPVWNAQTQQWVLPQQQPQQPYAQPPPAQSANPMAQVQQQVQQAAAMVSSFKRAGEDLQRAFAGDVEEEESPIPGMPPPPPDAPVPFRTMPLGNDMHYAFNETDGSPNWLGIGLANAPKFAGWFEKVANTVVKLQADKAAKEAAAAGGQLVIDVPMQPQFQPQPQQRLPAHVPQPRAAAHQPIHAAPAPVQHAPPAPVQPSPAPIPQALRGVGMPSMSAFRHAVPTS